MIHNLYNSTAQLCLLWRTDISHAIGYLNEEPLKVERLPQIRSI